MIDYHKDINFAERRIKMEIIINKDNTIIDVNKRIMRLNFENEPTGFVCVILGVDVLGKCSICKDDIMNYSRKNICHMPYDDTPLINVIANATSSVILFVDDKDGKVKAVFLIGGGSSDISDDESHDEMEKEPEHKLSEEESISK